MLRVDTDHPHDSFALDDLAFVTNLFYTGPDFHGLCLNPLPCFPHSESRDQETWRNFFESSAVSTVGDPPSPSTQMCSGRRWIVPASVGVCLVNRIQLSFSTKEKDLWCT